MGITADTIGVDVVANISTLKPGLDQAERVVDSSATRIQSKLDAAFAKGFSLKGLGRIYSIVAVFHAIKGAVEGINQAIELNENTYRGVNRQVNTWVDYTKLIVDNTAESIPLFGQVYSAVIGITDAITGKTRARARENIENEKALKILEAERMATEDIVDLVHERELLESRRQGTSAETKLRIEEEKARASVLKMFDAGASATATQRIYSEKVRIAQLTYEQAFRSGIHAESIQTAAGDFKVAGARLMPGARSQADVVGQLQRANSTLSAIAANTRGIQ